MVVVDLVVTTNFRFGLRSCAGNLFRFTALREISAPRRDALWTCVVIASCACVCTVRGALCCLPYVGWTLCRASARQTVTVMPELAAVVLESWSGMALVRASPVEHVKVAHRLC